MKPSDYTSTTMRMNFYCTVSISTTCKCMYLDKYTLYYIVAFTHTQSHKASNYSEWRCHFCLYIFLVFVLPSVFEGTPPEPGQLCEGEDSEWIVFVRAGLYMYLYVCACVCVCVWTCMCMCTCVCDKWDW
jgi:hypothetical protein